MNGSTPESPPQGKVLSRRGLSVETGLRANPAQACERQQCRHTQHPCLGRANPCESESAAGRRWIDPEAEVSNEITGGTPEGATADDACVGAPAPEHAPAPDQ